MTRLGIFLDDDGREQRSPFPQEDGPWELDEDDMLLYALLTDNVYAPELLWDDPKNRDYAGAYVVRDYQLPLFRGTHMYEGIASGRKTGKTESIKAKAFTHVFKRVGENMLITTPELIHLLPLADAIEDRIQACRLTREFLDTRNGKSGFTHRPFGVEYLDNTNIYGRIPRVTGVGVKGIHAPDLLMDECFPAGTLVLTEHGQIPIEAVKVGDRVLTHRGRWQPVTATAERQRPTVELAGQGHPGLITSENQPFWCRRAERLGRRSASEARRLRGGEMFEAGHTRAQVAASLGVAWQSADYWYRRWSNGGIDALSAKPIIARRRTNEKYKPLGSPQFIAARDLAPDDAKVYWSSPCAFPAMPLPTMPEGITVNDDFWWLLGFYMAEGCVGLDRQRQSLRQLALSVHEDEVEMVQRRLLSIGLESSAHEDTNSKGARVYPIAAATYRNWLVEHVGRVAAEHEVKPWLLGQPEWVRRLVLDGYVTGDGNLIDDDRYASGRWQAACADRKLILSIKLLAQSLGYYVGLYWTEPRSASIRGRKITGRGWYQIRGNCRSQSAFAEDDKHFALVKRAEPTGKIERLYDLTVGEDHSFIADTLVASNSQDYPIRGWHEVHEVVDKSHVDQDGNPDFTYTFYGVHSGARDSGFYKRTTEGGFRIIQITALQRPGWSKAEKDAAKAAYGGTSSPDYRRNIYGEPGAAASPLFVAARLISTMDQDRESAYNQRGYVHQEIRVEEFDELGLPIADVLDLPSGLKRVWAGADLGLTISPTVIMIFSEEKVAGKPRLKLVRRIHLERMRTRQIRHAFYALATHFGEALQGLGIDETGLGFPIFQEMEDDEAAPPILLERARGYFFNAKVPVGVAPENVTRDSQGNLRDQYGSSVVEQTDPMTGVKRFVVMMPMIEASTRYMREFVDRTFLMLPFDPEVVGDFQGDTAQRLKRIVGLKNKPNAYHILDACRAMAMVFKAGDVDAQLAVSEVRPVLDLAFDDIDMGMVA